MRHYLSLFLLFFITGLFGQSETECAAVFDTRETICYNSPMILATTHSLFYNTPPNINWSFVSFVSSVPGGPNITSNQIHITSQNGGFTANVAYTLSTNFPTGAYTFQLCVDCSDLNNNGTHDRPCETITIIVTPDVTQPVITESDGTQDGHIRACSQTTFLATPPASGETATVSFTPNDENVSYTIINGVVTVIRESSNVAGQICEYNATYTITNGGCKKSSSVMVRFISPYDPNHDGVIEGHIESCPSCTNTLTLIGDRPSCDGSGKGKWTLVDGPVGATMIPNTQFPSSGYAVVTVSKTGDYTFRYTVSNIDPCDTSTFDVSCTVYQLDSFSLNGDQYHASCDTVLPAGNYPFCFNNPDNAVFEWTTTTPGITFSMPHGHCSLVTATTDISLYDGEIIVNVSAFKYFLDPDCEGPNPPEEVVLGTNHEDNWAYIQTLLATPGICIESCTSKAKITFSGAPRVVIKPHVVNFLCNDGNEGIVLSDYFTVTNLLGPITATVIDQPAGIIPSVPYDVSPYQYLQLSVDTCGQYKFKIQATSYDNSVNPPTTCTSMDTLTINIETYQKVRAGADQVKCPSDPIGLNGNDPYCNAIGTWTQIQCSNLNYYQVSIDEIHNPSTPLSITVPNDSICPPDTLCFVWSFTSEGGCDLSDTTRVIIIDSCCNRSCAQNLHVSTSCSPGEATLTLLSDGGVLNPNEYTIIWTPGGQGNPVNIDLPPNGTVYYSVEVFKIINSDTLCHTVLPGVVHCPEVGCGAHVVESCDTCGNVKLTLVDSFGNIIVPGTYEEIFWKVYGNGINDPSPYPENFKNPITIQQDACYSLRYTHIIPPHIIACSYTFDKKCPTISCPGKCQDFNNFFIAACGDNLDISLNLTFPYPCQSFCGSQSNSGMLGVFPTGSNMPVNPALYNILWSNNAITPYTTGTLNLINTVTITSKTDPCCKWKDTYTPQCCSTPTPYIECQQPITKYCRPDGSFYYIIGAPQIFWTPVAGATGYIIKVTAGALEGCCTENMGMFMDTIYTNTWSIPPGLDCFTITIKAIIPGCPTNPGPPWSNIYTYCPQQVTCNPVLTVCGCCAGRSEESNAGLPVSIVSEEEILAFLKDNPGTEYQTLQDALNAVGVNASNSVDFKVYPNPASDQIMIKAGNAVKGTFKVQLTDMLQREWRNTTFDAGTEKALNVSDLPKGIYLITIRNTQGDLLQTEKITVLR